MIIILKINVLVEPNTINIFMKCLNCEIIYDTIYKTSKFCSRSCSATFNNKIKPKRSKSGKTTNCLQCNKEVYYYPGQQHGKYCSNVCQGKHVFETKTKPKIESGNCHSAPTLKKYLTEKKGYKCEKCSISNWLNQLLVLHLDHIDGNADNNIPDNLRLLCPNCHSQTETFCGGNKKNSKRSVYNKRYRIRKLNLTN